MGYYKNTLYYGPNGQDLSDNSPEARAERGEVQQSIETIEALSNPTEKPYRVCYRKFSTEPYRRLYFATSGEVHREYRRQCDMGRLAIKQYWSSVEKIWIG